MALLAVVVSLGLGLVRAPYLGVACHGANNTGCGRVGVAVWVKGRPAAIEARVGDARVRLRRPSASDPTAPWIGYVHLPLRAMGLPARWTGVPAKRLRVRLRIERASVWREGSRRVLLGPGWG
ncbi:MAG TPA: hypothetical protein VH538_08760 [Gaiellaceae bacterium]|jgi:hypothetical protein